MAKFVVSNDSNPTGTSLQDYLETSFSRLKRLFGDPGVGDDFKTSTEWIFRDETGEIICTVYDYKMTQLFDRNFPSVQAFRSRTNYAWHIGAKTRKEADIFIEWLKKELEKDD